LHSHLGQGFSGDYAINKCRQYVFGQRFFWVTDCYAIKFILSYKGSNHAILRLQMRLMCWDVDIVHRPDHELINADYWSRLGIDLHFNPLFFKYLDLTNNMRKSKPAPTDLPMRPENMPYYRRPRFQSPTPAAKSADTLHIQSLLTDLIVSDGQSARTLLNNEFARYAREMMNFDWAVYLLSNGHFPSTIESRNLPFMIHLACDSMERGRSLFHEFADPATVFSSGNDFLNHIRASGDQSVISGYLINSYRYQ
jgi:hypothetical protein